MKAEFLSLYHERYPRPFRDFAVASLESLLQTLGRFPRIFNFFLRGRYIRLLLSHVAGLVDLPTLGLNTVRRGYRLRKLERFNYESLRTLTDSEKAKTVLIVQDSFTTFFEPEVVLGVIDLLLILGYRPLLIPFFPNGKALHIKGFLRAFTALVRRNVANLERIAALGISLIGLEPAITLTYRDEYPHALGIAKLPFTVLLLQEWICDNLDEIRNKSSVTRAATSSREHYTLLGHCTEKTALPQSQKDWQQAFSAFGLSL